MRVDAGLARLLGLSRTAVAAVAEAGGVQIDGTAVGKSDKLEAGAWLTVTLPEEPPPVQNIPVEIEGMEILYSDDDIVAVDKPPGWQRTRRWAGTDPPCWAGWLPPASGSPPLASTSGGDRPPPRRRHLRRHGGRAVRAGLYGAQTGVQAAHRG